MGYIYVYQINTPSGTVIKVGHGTTQPKVRMEDYASTYVLDVNPSSLKYTYISDSKDCETFVHSNLVNKGFRNIRDGNYGPQEMFQAPRGWSYNDAAELVIQLANLREQSYAQINYNASDLVGGLYSEGLKNHVPWVSSNGVPEKKKSNFLVSLIWNFLGAILYVLLFFYIFVLFSL